MAHTFCVGLAWFQRPHGTQIKRVQESKSILYLYLAGRHVPLHLASAEAASWASPMHDPRGRQVCGAARHRQDRSRLNSREFLFNQRVTSW